MGDVMVPAGMEEDWIRHLIDLAGDPTLITTSHGAIGMVFYAPDDVIEAFNTRLASGAPTPAWGDGAPVQLSRTDDQSAVAEPLLSDDLAGLGLEIPKRRAGRPKGSKNKPVPDTEE